MKIRHGPFVYIDTFKGSAIEEFLDMSFFVLILPFGALVCNPCTLVHFLIGGSYIIFAFL